MKKRLQLFFSIIIFISLLGCANETSNTLVEFTDQKLVEVIEAAIGKEGEDITKEDVATITELDASERGISSLEGIELLTELEALNLEGNDIEDLSPLVSLENLVSLNVKGNLFSTEEGSDGISLILRLEENQVLVEYDQPAFVVEDGPRPQGVFYKVEEGSNTVYLLGSIHIGIEGLFPLHESIESAFAEADYLAVELDITDMDEMVITQHLIEYGMYTDGQTLQDEIGEEHFMKLLDLVSQYGVNDEILNMLKPWAAMDLFTSVIVEDVGYSSDYGIDLYFLEQAAGNMEVIPLETIEDQLAVFLVMSDQTQAEELVDAIDRYEEGLQEIEDLMDIWIEGDISALESLRHVDEGVSEEYREYMSALVDERDADMTEKIEEFLLSDRDETYFVVVGAMHLVGEKSIVGLLKEGGYDVQAAIN